MNRRQEQARETKSAILESALALFRERGFEHVTVDEITRRAEVAKGSFYTYFSTKSDIIVEEFWNIDGYYRQVAATLDRYDTAEQKLRVFTCAQTTYVRDSVGIGDLKILYANQVLQEGDEKVILNENRVWFTLIRRLIEEGQAAGEFRTEPDAGRLAALLNRTMRSLFLDWCIDDAAFDLVTEAGTMLDEWILPALSP